MNMRLTALGACIVLLSASLGAAQTNWPQFRGETAGVVADNPALPESWGPDENVAWRVDVPGRGWASPIVWGDHVFVLTSTAVEGAEVPIQPIENYRARSLGGTMTAAFITDVDEPLRWVLLDIDFETGETRWEYTLHTGVPALPTHQKSTFASETPVTDGERVYVYLADIGLFAVDFAGELAWSAPLDWLPRRQWGARARRYCTTAGSTWSTTTRTRRGWRPSMRRPAASCGGSIGTRGRTGPRRSCGRTTCGPSW